MTNDELWQVVLAELELSLSAGHFKSFFPQTKLTQNENGDLQIVCPNSYIKQRVELQYKNDLKIILDRLTKNDTVIKFTTQPAAKLTENTDVLPLFEKSQRTDRGIGLSTHYTFANFIVGNNNNLARAIAQAIVDHPGVAYNPFFLYSGVGLGKTHLIHAVGNEILSRHPDTTVLYCTGESFTNELLDSIQSGSRKNTAKFRTKFRSIDILLIDDIQFIAGRETTQEEFFHTFNDLYLAKKQIVLTSDRPPKEIARLEERLSSRFAGGIIADMQPPDFDMRVAILRKKAKDLNIDITEPTIDSIARSTTTNVRELEGIFHQVLVQAQTQNISINQELVDRILPKMALNKSNELTPQKIIKTVCTYYTVKPQDLRGERRLKELVRPRQITMYLLRTLSELPLTEVGELLGRRDHTTVMHGVDKIERLMKENPQVREQVSVLKSQICG